GGRHDVEPGGIRSGGKSSHPARNIDRRAAKPGRREGAKAEKAVPFPGAVRRSESFLASLRSTHFCGGTDHARDTGGRNRVVRSIRGRTGWVELSEASGSHPALRRAPDFLAATRCAPLPSIGSSISRCPSTRLLFFFAWAGAPRSACTLRRKASMRLMTLRGAAARSFTFGGLKPACFLRNSSTNAVS